MSSNGWKESKQEGLKTPLISDGNQSNRKPSVSYVTIPQDNTTPTPAFTGQTKIYSFVVLTILLLVYLCNQLSRSILPFIKSQIANDLGISEKQYSFLAGYGFSLIFVMAGIPIGRFMDDFNRKYVLVVCLFIWSGSTLLSAYANNFGYFFAARLGLGIGTSGCNPAAFSLIADYFPTEWRALALSIYNFAIYAGSCLGSALGKQPWNDVLLGLGIYGLGLCVILIFVVREPPRGQYTQQPVLPQEQSEDERVEGQVINDPRSDDDINAAKSKSANTKAQVTIGQVLHYWCSIDSTWMISFAGGVRNLGGYAYGAHVFNLLNARYNLNKERPDIFNYFAAITLVAGVSSSFLGGYVTKRWSQSNPLASSYVPAVGSILSIPFIFCIVFMEDWIGAANDKAFGLALASVFMSYLTAEVWGGAAGASYQSVMPASMQGLGISIYFFILTLLGGAGSELVTAFPINTYPPNANSIKSSANQYALSLVIVGSYALSSIIFLISSFFLPKDQEFKNKYEETKELPQLSRARVGGIIIGLLGCIALAVYLIVDSFSS